MKTFKRLLILIFILLVSGCVPIPQYMTTSTPLIQTVENEYFTASLSPMFSYGSCISFTLLVKNKTEKDIEIDWNKTSYIDNGQTRGGFMYEGVIYKDRNNLKPPDFVLSGGSLQKTIWPNIRLDYSSYFGWVHGYMKEGEHGALLVGIIDGKEVREKMLLSFSTLRTN